MARTRGSSRPTSSAGDPQTVAKAPAQSKPPIVPAPLQFPLLVVLSMTLSSFLYAGSSSFTSGDLSTVSGYRDQWYEVAGLLAWRASELAVGWWGGYDSERSAHFSYCHLLMYRVALDLASLTFLTHLPYLFFLVSFYKIRPTTAAFCLTIDMVATCVPFLLLRGSSNYHMFKAPKGAVANRTVVNDYGVQAFTSLLAAGVYGVVIFGSFGSWMPVYLVSHFDGIRDISSLYNAQFPWLIAAFIPTGIAAKVFLFTPATAAKPDAADKEMASFDPETASLGETIMYNLWGHSKRVRTLIERTAILVVVGGLHTWLHTFVAVDGAEGFGAAGWSSVWALAATLTGVAFWWVGDVEGMSN